jgi:FkbM family methyltransferase
MPDSFSHIHRVAQGPRIWSIIVSSSARAILKGIVPGPLWVAGRRTANYLRRLRNWRAVLREVKGVTPADEEIIRRSARVGKRNAMRSLDTWQDPVLVDDATVRLGGIGEFAVRGNSDDLFAILPSRERAVVAAFRRILQPGCLFVDAGANVGFFTLLGARLVGGEGRVIAIEMMPDTAARLRANVARNAATNVTIAECALSNRSGEEVRAVMPENQYARASIAETPAPGQREVSVLTQTLDVLLIDVPGTIELIKMDLEGAEPMAIAGAERILARTRFVIFEQLGGDAAAELLESKGFRLRTLDSTNVLAER